MKLIFKAPCKLHHLFLANTRNEITSLWRPWNSHNLQIRQNSLLQKFNHPAQYDNINTVRSNTRVFKLDADDQDAFSGLLSKDCHNAGNPNLHSVLCGSQCCCHCVTHLRASHQISQTPLLLRGSWITSPRNKVRYILYKTYIRFLSPHILRSPYILRYMGERKLIMFQRRKEQRHFVILIHQCVGH